MSFPSRYQELSLLGPQLLNDQLVQFGLSIQLLILTNLVKLYYRLLVSKIKPTTAVAELVIKVITALDKN